MTKSSHLSLLPSFYLAIISSFHKEIFCSFFIVLCTGFLEALRSILVASAYQKFFDFVIKSFSSHMLHQEIRKKTFCKNGG